MSTDPNLEQKLTKGTKNPRSSRPFFPFVAFCSNGLEFAVYCSPEPRRALADPGQA